MCVEERVNRASSGKANHMRHQRVGTLCRAAIDEQDAARSRLRENVAFSGKTEQEQIVAQLLRDGDVDRGLRGLALRKPRSGGGGRAQNESGSASDCGLQDFSTCVSVRGHHGSR